MLAIDRLQRYVKSIHDHEFTNSEGGDYEGAFSYIHYDHHSILIGIRPGGPVAALCLRTRNVWALDVGEPARECVGGHAKECRRSSEEYGDNQAGQGSTDQPVTTGWGNPWRNRQAEKR